MAGLRSVGAAGAVDAGGFTVSAAVRVTLANTAEMVAKVDAVTEVLVIVKFALVAPADTVTLASTVVEVELSERVTNVPPEGAAALRVTVPVEELPPVTVVGLSAKDERVTAPGVAGSTQRTGWSPFPSLQTVIITGVETATLLVVTVKVALLPPAGTVTLAGTDATAGWLLDSVYTCPPAGAAFWMCTLPWTVLPPTTPFGVSEVAAKLVQMGAPTVNFRTSDHGLKLLTPSSVRTRQ